jgi:hypothetical protein
LNFISMPISVKSSFIEDHGLGLQAKEQGYSKLCPTLSGLRYCAPQ